MDPQCWGPRYWSIFFDCAFWFDKRRDASTKPVLLHLFKDLVVETLPCSVCRDHYAEHLAQPGTAKHLEGTETAADSNDISSDTTVAERLVEAVENYSLFEWLYDLKARVIAQQQQKVFDEELDRKVLERKVLDSKVLDRKVQFDAKNQKLFQTATSPSLRVLRARHETLQSGESTVDDLIFVLYATALEQFTRDEASRLDCASLRDYVGTLYRACSLVPALSSFVARSVHVVVPDTNCAGVKAWFLVLIDLFERTSGRDVVDVVNAFYSLCSVKMRRRALKYYTAEAVA
jgi:hypothetical protein